MPKKVEDRLQFWCEQYAHALGLDLAEPVTPERVLMKIRYQVEEHKSEREDGAHGAQRREQALQEAAGVLVKRDDDGTVDRSAYISDPLSVLREARKQAGMARERLVKLGVPETKDLNNGYGPRRRTLPEMLEDLVTMALAEQIQRQHQ